MRISDPLFLPQEKGNLFKWTVWNFQWNMKWRRQFLNNNTTYFNTVISGWPVFSGGTTSANLMRHQRLLARTRMKTQAACRCFHIDAIIHETSLPLTNGEDFSDPVGDATIISIRSNIVPQGMEGKIWKKLSWRNYPKREGIQQENRDIMMDVARYGNCIVKYGI